MFQFGAAQFGLGRNQLVNMLDYPDEVNAYRKYILDTALLLGAEENDSTLKDVEDMIQFESQLAEVSMKNFYCNMLS